MYLRYVDCSTRLGYSQFVIRVVNSQRKSTPRIRRNWYIAAINLQDRSPPFIALSYLCFACPFSISLSPPVHAPSLLALVLVLAPFLALSLALALVVAHFC